MTRTRPPGPDARQVSSTIAYLQRLDDMTYANSLADMALTNLSQPKVEDFPNQAAFLKACENWELDSQEYQVQRAAFGSPELAERSLIAAKLKLAEVNDQLARKRRDGETKTAWFRREAGMRRFQRLIGAERQRLELIVAGLRAQAGFVPNAPNPRRRALDELAARHAPEFRQLVRKHERLEKERKAEQRRLQKLAAKEAKRGGGPSGPRPPQRPYLIPA